MRVASSSKGMLSAASTWICCSKASNDTGRIDRLLPDVQSRSSRCRPAREDEKNALAPSLKDTHGRIASYWNAVYHSSGHVRQGRYYSCPLDEGHLWEALRYTELNPVRASLVRRAPDWPWSSAAVHCGAAPVPPWLDMDFWGRR
jgi:hypothetical protein